jgi:hypothetical protein
MTTKRSVRTAAKGAAARLRPVPTEAAVPEGIESAASERLVRRIVQRPDGYHWIAPDGHQEFGPFETLELAMADMIDGADEHAPQPGETLQEAESEIGIADWIDPETGEPAEGSCPPHLEPE